MVNITIVTKNKGYVEIDISKRRHKISYLIKHVINNYLQVLYSIDFMTFL